MVYAVIGIVLLFTVVPFLYLFLTSVKPPGLMFASPPRFIFNPDFRYYVEILFKKGFIRYYGNSFLVSAIATFLAIFVGSLASYAFVKYKFTVATVAFFLIVFTRAFMPATTIIPLYMAARALNLLDTKLLLILAYTGFQLPLAVLVTTNFFRDIPHVILESAELDGLTQAGIFFRIVLPLSRAGLFAAGLLIFIFCWNEFLFALVTTSFDARTATVALTGFVESETTIHWGELSTLGVFMSIPVVVFALVFNKLLLSGILAGAVKG